MISMVRSNPEGTVGFLVDERRMGRRGAHPSVLTNGKLGAGCTSRARLFLRRMAPWSIVLGSLGLAPF